ncbi:hypothetical protein YC2023_020166 [Brassica napus]
MLMHTLLAFQESSSPTQTRELLNSLKQDEFIDIFVDAADGVVTRDTKPSPVSWKRIKQRQFRRIHKNLKPGALLGKPLNVGF